MGHFASSCTKSKMDQGSNKDSRKEKAMESAVWGESDSDEKPDDKRRIALITSLDTEIRPFAKNSPYKKITIEQNEIILIL